MSNRSLADEEAKPVPWLGGRSPLRRISPLGPPWSSLFLLLVGAGFVIGYLSLAYARVSYPYALDLVEEDMLMQAWRARHGQPVFLPPNADFVPQVYMPLYAWLAGQMLRLSGPAFWPLRALSLASTVATSLLVFWISYRESRQGTLAFTSAALYLAGYRLVGGWYDLARVDPLFVVLVLAGMAMAVYGRYSSRGLFLAGILMGLSLLTKQNGLALAAVVGAYLLLTTGRRAWIYAATFTLVTLLPILFLEWRSQGWFSYYAIDIAYASPLSEQRIWQTVSRELAGGMGFLLLAALLAATLVARRITKGVGRWRELMDNPWLWFIAAAVAVSVAGRASVGGNLNNLIPAYALFCLSPGLLFRQLQAGAPQPDGHDAGRSTLSQVEGRSRWLSILLIVGILGQFGLTLYNPIQGKPTQYRPTEAMRDSGQRLVQMLAGFDGEVLVLMHPSYALMVGKEPAVHIQSLWHARQRGHDPLPADFNDRIASQQYGLIISDDSDFFEKDPALQNLLAAYYREARRLAPEESPPTLSGPVVRPLIVYVPVK